MTPSLRGERTSLFDFSSSFNTGLFGISFPLAEICLGFALIYLFVRYPKVFLYTLIGFGYFFAVLYLVYNTKTVSSQKTAIFITFFTIPLWLLHTEPRRAKNCFDRLAGKLEIYKLYSCYFSVGALCFAAPVFSIPKTLLDAKADYRGSFSYSREVSDYLNSLEDGAFIISGSDQVSTAAIDFVPYLEGNRVIYNAVADEPFGYMAWDADDEIAPDAKISELIARYADRPVYILASSSSCPNVKPTGITIDDSWQEVNAFAAASLDYDIPIKVYKVR